MAINPPLLADSLMPCGILGEFYLLKRRGISIAVDTHDRHLGVLKGAGVLYLTTVRMVFVADRQGGVMSSFDIPLEGISNETFKQPIFGANRLELDVAPVPGRGLPSVARVSITFYEGGTNTLLRFFFAVMEQYRRPVPERMAFFSAPQAFIDSQVAYVDASDPSVIYLTQPAPVSLPPPQQQQYQPQLGYAMAQPSQGQQGYPYR